MLQLDSRVSSSTVVARRVPERGWNAGAAAQGRALCNRIDRVYGNWQIVRATVRGEKGQPRPAFALSSTMRISL